MNMPLALIMLMITLELVVANTMICRKIPKRSAFAWRTLLCTGLSVSYIVFLAFFPPDQLVVHMPIIAIAFLYVWLCYETTLRQVLYIGTAAYLVQRISSLLNTLVAYFLPENFMHDASTLISPQGYLVIILCDVVVFTVFYFTIARRIQMMDIQQNATLRVVVFSLIVVIMNQPWTLSMLHTNIGDHSRTAYALVETIWNIVACVLCIVIQFDIKHIDRKDSELMVAKNMIAEKERQYKMSKYNIDSINRKCHDLKYELAALSKGEDSEKHISEAMDLIESFDSAIHTGSDTLDIIFTEKNQYCKSHDIEFVCMVDGKKLDFMDVTDQYVMFGNIIDNAINAVRKIENHSKRSIYLRIFQDKGFVMVQTENAFVGHLEFRNGLPRTTSGDEFNHGYGMSSIRMIAERYGGSMNARAENGVFYLSIMFAAENQEVKK